MATQVEIEVRDSATEILASDIPIGQWFFGATSVSNAPALMLRTYDSVVDIARPRNTYGLYSTWQVYRPVATVVIAGPEGQ